MAGNSQKTAVARTLNTFAERKVLGAIAQLGQGLPAQVVAVAGSIVTVKFLLTSVYTLPNVTCSLNGPQWWRQPTQVGDKGVVLSASAYIGGVTGLGGGTADLSQRANLSTLIFFPVGSTDFSETDDPNAHVIYGPDGAIIRDTGKKNVLTWAATGVTMSITAGTLTINIPGSESVVINGNVQINGGLALSGPITAPDGISTYAQAIKTSADVVAGQGTTDQVSQLNHTHQYNAPTTGSTPEQTNPPTAGT